MTLFRMLLLVTVALSGYATTIVDTNCTSGGAYTANAVSCSNVYSDSACAILYPSSTVAQGATTERPTNCYAATATATTVNQDLKDIAVANCPKTCGYCCQTNAYSCSNIAYPRINCATVTTAMCNDATWRSIIASDCPNSCGFCLLGGCIDNAVDCSDQPQICVTIGLEAFVAENCQRTCGLCSSSSTSTTKSSSSSTCTSYTADSSSLCSTWAKNGFCTNSFYTTAQKKSYCGTTCKIC